MYNFPYYFEQLIDCWPEKLTFGAICGTLSSAFGGDVFLWGSCFGMLTADLVLGLWSAFSTGRFSYVILERGIIKFPAYAVYIILASVLQRTVSQAFGAVVPLLDMFLAYLVFTDAISVLRHLKELGLPVPPLLEAIAQRGRKKIEEKVG